MNAHFASDNVCGLEPGALAAIQAANLGCCPSYGLDEFTAQAVRAIQQLFAPPAEVFFVFTGSAANALALGHLCRSFHSIVTHPCAHIETDECGGPEFFTGGSKILPGSGADGKLSPQSLEALVTRRQDVHFPPVRAFSISQPTECGTVYSLEELRALRAVKERHRLFLHLDGARFANAVASLQCSPSQIIEASGADVLTFGGVKPGFALAEAVVFFNQTLAADFPYRRKQAGQLSSKMRFLSAGWAYGLAQQRWLNLASHANAMASSLAAGLSSLGFPPVFPVQANAVFVSLPEPTRAHLAHRGWTFYSLFPNTVRLMCHWATSPQSIQAFLRDFPSP